MGVDNPASTMRCPGFARYVNSILTMTRDTDFSEGAAVKGRPMEDIRSVVDLALIAFVALMAYGELLVPI